MRLVIAEDQALLREGLARLFSDAGHEVVAAVDDAVRLRGAVSEHVPDLAVVDVRMPPTHTNEGLQGAHWIRESYPDVSVLLLSQHVESRLSVDLVAGGHFGYLLKDRVLDVTQFLDALDRVADGGSALDPEVVARLMVGGSPGLASLTPREHEVLALMAEGLTNAGIAARVVIAERTVETHVARILGKLGLAEATTQDHRRVLAVLRYLEGHRPG